MVDVRSSTVTNPPRGSEGEKAVGDVDIQVWSVSSSRHDPAPPGSEALSTPRASLVHVEMGLVWDIPHRGQVYTSADCHPEDGFAPANFPSPSRIFPLTVIS